MLVKIILLLLFFGCMIAVGLYARKSANSMTVWVEVWPSLHLDWSGQCSEWLAGCMGCDGQAHASHDASSRGGDNAGLFRAAL